MAFNIPGVPFKLTAQDVGSPDLQSAIQKGLQSNLLSGKGALLAGQAAFAPKQMAEDLLHAQLANKISSTQAKYAEPLAQLGIQLKQSELGLSPLRQKLLESQIKRQEQLVNDPFAGHIPPGAVGQQIWLKKIGEKYGEDSDIFKGAKNSLELQNESARTLNDYRKKLGETATKRSSTGLGKLQQELVEVDAGFLPGSNGSIPLTKDQQNALRGQYELKIQKDVSDVDTRKRALFASNIDKTLDSINVKDLVQYGGLYGSVAKKIQEGKALTGRESQSYRDFQEALVGAKTLAKQVRQFYGDSITPQIQEQLASLTNPASWINNPKIAENNFNKFASILRKESATYKNAGKNTDEFNNKSNKKELTFNPQTGGFE